MWGKNSNTGLCSMLEALVEMIIDGSPEIQLINSCLAHIFFNTENRATTNLYFVLVQIGKRQPVLKILDNTCWKFVIIYILYNYI